MCSFVWTSPCVCEYEKERERERERGKCVCACVFDVFLPLYRCRSALLTVSHVRFLLIRRSTGIVGKSPPISFYECLSPLLSSHFGSVDSSSETEIRLWTSPYKRARETAEVSI
jgi:hypothetical protein